MSAYRRHLSLLTVLVLVVVALPASAQTDSLQGEWLLDLKASKNLPDSQKNVDLRIAIKGNVLTTWRLVSGKVIGSPIVMTLDGTARQLEVSPGQNATVSARWLERGKTYQQDVSMRGQVGIVVRQKTVVQLSDDGLKMTRAQEIDNGGNVDERTAIYKRKE